MHNLDKEMICANGIILFLAEIATCVVCDGPDWLVGAWLVGLGVSVVGVMYYEWVRSRL